MIQPLLLSLLTLVASGIGTATGFGTSTVMVPVLSLFLPVPVALLFVGIIHLCGDLWKILLFRKGLVWRLVFGFGIPGMVTSYLGASLSFQTMGLPLRQMLGGVLILYVFSCL